MITKNKKNSVRTFICDAKLASKSNCLYAYIYGGRGKGGKYNLNLKDKPNN